MQSKLKRRQILAEVKIAIRSPYAWPGGYPIYTVLGDGALLCPDCARAEFRQIVRSTMAGLRDGWDAAGASVLWESGADGAETCAHCNKILEAAYGND